MKKIFLWILIFSALILALWVESRKFFCLSNRNCVTIWKTYNNVCYIIPGKYYGLTKPAGNFIESTNTNNITLYFSDALPNTFVYKSEQKLKIHNDVKNTFVFYNYDSNEKKFDSVLYMPDAKRLRDVKPNVQLMDVSIQENYAIDKNGKNL